MIKKFIIRGLVGVGIGNLLACFIALVISWVSPEFSSITIFEYLKYTIAGSVIGFAFAGASTLFEDDDISLFKATIIHFFILTLSYYSMALMAGWLRLDAVYILISLSIFIGIYACMWIVIYLIQKHKVKEINQQIFSNKK